MSTEPDPQNMDRDALIAEIVTLRRHRDQLRKMLQGVATVGGPVVRAARDFEDTLDEVDALFRWTDPTPEPLVTYAVQVGPGPIASALLRPTSPDEPDESDKR
ncbi:hypothetical protein BJD60_gp66 [Gordonia phage Schnabeltier]|uniref:Uncharacterized protein n=1 Tax=Gordonia phage Schnabeltier TaxID=1821561 RepID=A0A142KA54_9CAUD|nr:hypothetical protein BJD60_gp66 [Gordonia phage Schnabeltier]AMS02987.1 hypothetical protein SEA_SCHNABELTIER_66 [Gordonia phage Schnabeltier]